MTKRTPLYDWHVLHGATCTLFHDWEMPVQYSSIIAEHRAVRNDVGMFDVSHMGEIVVQGPEAKAFLQWLVTNDMSRIKIGRAIYTLMTDATGGTVDDFLVYQLEEDKFMLVVNAGNILSDFEWVCSHSVDYRVKVRNVSDDIALIALQGPNATRLLSKIAAETSVETAKPFRFVHGTIGSHQLLLSRTGYTGEDGFELYMEADAVVEIADILFREGAVPCGLGARDTLRIEAYLPLYGHELTKDISPLEASLGWVVKFNKGDFVGRETLYNQQSAGVTRKSAGVQMIGKAVPRSDYSVYCEGQCVGRITSGTYSPTLDKSIGIALIDVDTAVIGQHVDVEIRGKFHPGKIVETPFYRRSAR